MTVREFYVSPENVGAMRRAITRVISKVGTALTATIDPVETVRRAHYHEIEAAYGHIELVLDGYSPLQVHKVTLTIDLDQHLLGGYRLLARRTAAPDNSDFIEGYVGETDRVSVPDLHRTACQACGRKVPRSETYIIASPTGAVMQVGGQCKDQFIPAAAVGYISQLRALLFTVQELATDPTDSTAYGGSRETMYRIEAVIAQSLVHLQAHPFVPSQDKWGQSNANATWREVKDKVTRTIMLEQCISTPWSPDISKCIHDLRNSERETDRDITAYDWCNMKGLAYLPSAVRSWMKRQAEAQKPHVEAAMPPTGRVTLEGTVTSQKLVESDYGSVYKMILDCGAYRVWGTVPSGLAVGLGDKVRLTATVQPKELGFGFYSRPSKAELIPA